MQVLLLRVADRTGAAQRLQHKAEKMLAEADAVGERRFIRRAQVRGEEIPVGMAIERM